MSKCLTGEYEHRLDTKGRLIMPSKLREELGCTFMITKGLDNCLYVYPNDEWQQFADKLNQLPMTNKSARQFKRFFQNIRTEVVVMEFKHTSVLLDETIENLNIRPDGVYMDGTLGGAGHSKEIAKRLGPDGHLIGIDQDGEAIITAKERLAEYGDRITVVRDNYQNFKSILDELNILQVDGILLDLGVSSYQLDNADRGFTYRVDAPLDMRMDDRQTKTAKDIVNGYTEQELFHILKEYGEERFAKSIAYHIVKYREKKEIETTEELNDIIRGSIPAKVRNAQGHPSKQTFQAIRIELNHELEVLTNSIDGMIDCLKPGGRLCIITFHSLEDRIVKNAFRKNENPCICPPNFPVCTCGRKSKGKVITRKPILPTEEEMEANSRSKSAKLRVFEKGMNI